MGVYQKGFDRMLKESFNVECVEVACAFSLRGGRVFSVRTGWDE